MPNDYQKLSKLIALHETYFAALAQQNPTSKLLRTFLRQTWDPFFLRWGDLVTTHHVSNVDADILAETARDLSAIRSRARMQQIPVPNITGESVIMAGPHHGGGHHGGHHGGRRRFYGGGWYGPAYGYWDYPYPYDADSGTDITIQNPENVTIGAVGRHATQGRELAALGAVLAPGANGVRTSMDLDGATLTVKICVDGRCYESAIDLSGVLAGAGAALRAWHEREHAEGAAAMPEVKAAGQILIGAMLDQHAQEICAGFWGSITHGISSAVGNVAHGITHGISSAAGTVGHTLKKLKGPISIAAGAAAGAAAAAIPGVGVVAAPMAASLAKNLVDAAAGDNVNVQQAAQGAIQAASAAAQTDPHMKAALDTAQKAVAQTTAAFHIADTVAKAGQGDTAAQKQVEDLSKSAASGDSAAKTAIATAQRLLAGDTRVADPSSVMSPAYHVDESQIEMYDPTTTGVPTAAPEVAGELLIGAVQVTLRDQASRAAMQMPGQVIGVALTGDGWQLKPFDSVDDADDWFGNATDIPHTFVYVAYFDKGDPLFPAPLNEAHGTLLTGEHAARGRHEAIQRGAAIASGIPLPLLAAASAAAGYFGVRAYRHRRAQQQFDAEARRQIMAQQKSKVG